MLINLSNHPVSKWSEHQLSEANRLYGSVQDLPFPTVDPNGGEAYIDQLSDDYISRIFELASGSSFVVHIMGELTFSFVIVRKLMQRNIQCVASTTERIVKDYGDGRKEVQFSFVTFRKYL